MTPHHALEAAKPTGRLRRVATKTALTVMQITFGAACLIGAYWGVTRFLAGNFEPPLAGAAEPITAGAAKDTRSQAPATEHRVVIQVTQNDPGLMHMALNNAQNLTTHYDGKGERVKIEFVAYGPGLHMLRSDTSPVKDRLSTFALQNPKTVFSACGNTLNNQSKQESKEITLVSEARIVETGIARVMELQEQGWAYVRP